MNRTGHPKRCFPPRCWLHFVEQFDQIAPAADGGFERNAGERQQIVRSGIQHGLVRAAHRGLRPVDWAALCAAAAVMRCLLLRHWMLFTIRRLAALQTKQRSDGSAAEPVPRRGRRAMPKSPGRQSLSLLQYILYSRVLQVRRIAGRYSPSPGSGPNSEATEAPNLSRSLTWSTASRRRRRTQSLSQSIPRRARSAIPGTIHVFER